MAIMEAESLASDVLAQTLQDVLEAHELDGEKLVRYFYDEMGKIFAYTIDTVTINNITSDAVARMNELIAREEDMVIHIPAGTILRNPLVAGLGADVPIRIRLVGNTGANYEREFVSAGINEINHRVWIHMQVSVQVAAPLLSEVLTAEMDFPLVDQYISGDTPMTYLGLAS